MTGKNKDLQPPKGMKVYLLPKDINLDLDSIPEEMYYPPTPFKRNKKGESMEGKTKEECKGCYFEEAREMIEEEKIFLRYCEEKGVNHYDERIELLIKSEFLKKG